MHANENGNMACKKEFHIFTETQPKNTLKIMDVLDRLVTWMLHAIIML